MTAEAYREVIAVPPRDRRDLFLTAAQRLGTPLGNIEKDFWVCWTLGELYHDLPQGSPRLLFKGGTALSKAYGLIQRFSEDIDITVFRDDLGQPASIETLEALSGKKRRAKLEAIRDACRAYITGPLREALAVRLADVTRGEGCVELMRTIRTARAWSPSIRRWRQRQTPMAEQSLGLNQARSRRSIRMNRDRYIPTSLTWERWSHYAVPGKRDRKVRHDCLRHLSVAVSS